MEDRKFEDIISAKEMIMEKTFHKLSFEFDMLARNIINAINMVNTSIFSLKRTVADIKVQTYTENYKRNSVTEKSGNEKQNSGSPGSSASTSAKSDTDYLDKMEKVGLFMQAMSPELSEKIVNTTEEAKKMKAAGELVFDVWATNKIVEVAKGVGTLASNLSKARTAAQALTALNLSPMGIAVTAIGATIYAATKYAEQERNSRNSIKDTTGVMDLKVTKRKVIPSQANNYQSTIVELVDAKKYSTESLQNALENARDNIAYDQVILDKGTKYIGQLYMGTLKKRDKKFENDYLHTKEFSIIQEMLDDKSKIGVGLSRGGITDKKRIDSILSDRSKVFQEKFSAYFSNYSLNPLMNQASGIATELSIRRDQQQAQEDAAKAEAKRQQEIVLQEQRRQEAARRAEELRQAALYRKEAERIKGLTKYDVESQNISFQQQSGQISDVKAIEKSSNLEDRKYKYQLKNLNNDLKNSKSIVERAKIEKDIAELDSAHILQAKQIKNQHKLLLQQEAEESKQIDEQIKNSKAIALLDMDSLKIQQDLQAGKINELQAAESQKEIIKARYKIQKDDLQKQIEELEKKHKPNEAKKLKAELTNIENQENIEIEKSDFDIQQARERQVKSKEDLRISAESTWANVNGDREKLARLEYEAAFKKNSEDYNKNLKISPKYASSALKAADKEAYQKLQSDLREIDTQELREKLERNEADSIINGTSADDLKEKNKAVVQEQIDLYTKQLKGVDEQSQEALKIKKNLAEAIQLQKTLNDPYADKEKDLQRQMEHNNAMAVINGTSAEELKKQNRSVIDAQIEMYKEQLEHAKITADERLAIEQKLANAIQEQKNNPQSFAEAWKAGTQEATSAFQDWNSMVKDMAKDAAGSIQSNLSDAFKGLLTNEFGSFKDRWQKFWQDLSNILVNTISDALAQIATDALLGWLKGFIPGIGGSSDGGGGGIIPDNEPTTDPTKYPTTQTLQPMPTIMSTASTQSNPSNVQVNIVNNSGQQVNVSQEKQVNGQDVVINMVIDAVNRNAGGLRDTLRYSLGGAY